MKAEKRLKEEAIWGLSCSRPLDGLQILELVIPAVNCCAPIIRPLCGVIYATLPPMATAIPPLKDSEKIEVGYADGEPRKAVVGAVSSIIVASYNIRYAVGSYLISNGLLRKIGLRGDRKRAKYVAQNIQTAARAFSAGQLLPH